MHVLFVTFFNLFVFHLQVDVVSPLLLNASLLLVLTTDYSDCVTSLNLLLLLVLTKKTKNSFGIGHSKKSTKYG